MPKPVARMDQNSDRRGMYRFGAPRPLLERPERGPAKGKQRLGAEFARQSLDHPPAPAVERIVQTVACFRRCDECAPAVAPGHAGKHDCANVSERADAFVVLELERAARNEAGSFDGGDYSLDVVAFHAGRPAHRRQIVFSSTHTSALLVYIRTILRQRPGWRKNSSAEESKSGATAETFIGRSLQRSHSRRVSGQRPYPRALASRPSTCRAAVGLNVPGDRARRPERRPDASWTAYRQPHAARAHWGMPSRGGDRLRRPQYRPLFRSIHRERQGMRALHRAHAARGRRAHPRRNARPPAASRSEAARPMPGGQDTLRRRGARLWSSGGKPRRRGTLFQWTLRRLVSHEPSAYPGRSAERLRARSGCRNSGNGISAALDFAKYVFINGDLTINLFRRPEGEWICLDSRSLFGGNGCGLAESALYDERGMIGRAAQSLTVRLR